MGKLITLAQLRQDVRDRYDIQATSARLPNTILDRMINTERDALFARVLNTDEGYTESRTQVVTTAGVPFISLPDRFAELVAVHATLNGKGVPLQSAAADDLGESAYTPSWRDCAPRFRIQGNTLYFSPPPDGVYTITTTTLRALEDLVADTDAWDAHPLMAEWVTYGVVAKLFERDRDLPTAQWMRNRQQQLEAELSSLLEGQDRSGPAFARRLADRDCCAEEDA